MNEQAKKATKRTRRWLKVSLRTFLLAITVLCVWLGFIVNRANKQKQAVAWVRENGGTVYYDFEWDEEEKLLSDDADPPDPDWLREWIGVDYFAKVMFVSLHGHDITHVRSLASLTDLRMLELRHTSVRDLSPLTRMTAIQELVIIDTPVSDLTPLARMKDMKLIVLDDTQVSDLSPLAGITDVGILIDYKQQAIIPPELKSHVHYMWGD